MLRGLGEIVLAVQDQCEQVLHAREAVVGVGLYAVAGALLGFIEVLEARQMLAAVTLNAGITYQTIQGWGAAAVYPTNLVTIAQAGAIMRDAGMNVVRVTPTAANYTYTVGGTVSGLTGTVVLQNNGSTLSQSANGAFTFAAGLTSGTAYSVTVQTQPVGQTCAVSNGAGTISGANVTNVAVVCSSTVTLPIITITSPTATSRMTSGRSVEES